ncbi:hypothetical protein XENOCAPTIV_015444 [Xenoophorus captivus]|uniref:Uncharacterized protein n=1 Tax=Xenoophorus captivus TaxID=1517983 RepID=A0ABV0RKS2_9TELE
MSIVLNSVSNAFHLLLPPEVSICRTIAPHKRPTSEVINPDVRGKSRGAQMMTVRECRRARDSTEGHTQRQLTILFEKLHPSYLLYKIATSACSFQPSLCLIRSQFIKL